MVLPQILTGLLFSAVLPAVALPWPPLAQDAPEIFEYNSTISARANPGDFFLRILPLGASIVAGDYSQDASKNGFRKFTRDKLVEQGWKVNMVGNRNSGSMSDNDHEGISGQVVQDIAKRGRESAATWLPNVVLVNAGTNDANDRKSDVDAGRTGLQMKELIEGIFAEVPQAVVVLSTLLPKGSNADYVEKINKQYRTVYRQFVPLGEDGKEESNPQFKVVLAEMQPWLSIGDIHDGTHPTIYGERKMAAAWVWAIGVANDRGWIKEPKQSSLFKDGESSRTCRKKFGSGASDPRSGRQILFASDPAIRDDGTYRHKSQLRDDRKGSFTNTIGGGPDKDMTKTSDMWFAQLVNLKGSPKGDERDELILAPSDKSDRRFTVYVNNGNGEFNDGFSIDPKMSCSNAHIRWGDVNGDGLDDFICIQTNGELYVSINKGGSPPTFQNVGLYKGQEMGLGRDRVRLGDMDGDGRLDYCVISNAGNIHCWRNGGIGDKAAYWQDMGQGSHIFASQNTGDMRGVQLVDMNGDGRYDWTWMSKEGQVKTFINQRGDGKGMKPFWRGAGITHPGRGFNIGEDREFIKWGRIFSGRPSYVNWQREGLLCNGGVTCRITYQVWENQGEGGTSQKGDGIFWGDTTGSGVDDYVWISMHGEVNVFVNKNTRSKHDFYETNAWGTPSMINTGLPRRALHLADWDGDGKDDIIGVTDLRTGALKVWYSRYNDGKHNWDAQLIPNPPVREWCTQGFGRLPFDNAHYFADLTGSGRTDYICMAPSGQAWAWLRGKDGVAKPSGQIKYTEDLDRANFQFADINGDGKADLIHKDKFSGDTQVWYFDRVVSEAERPGNSGSIIKWDRPERLFRGSVRGPDTHYPRLNNQGRADMVYAKATNAQAHISFNVCPAGGDDDERDADLPTYRPPELSPDPEGDWFCGKGNGAKWTTSLWREHGVGTWLRQRTDLYSAAENSWPNDDAKGVPRIIAEYDVFNRDRTFNWHTSCRAISDSCDFVNPLEEADDCSKHQERAFALWAMGNFALFQQKWYKAVKDGVDSASKSSGAIADKFLPVSAEDALANPAAWLTIVAGMFTTIGGIAPGMLGNGVNFVAGVLTIGAGAASFGADSTEPSPQFKSFASLDKALGDMVEWTRKAMAAQFNRYFVETPPNNDRPRGSELARAIESGIWANQDIAQADSETIWDSGRVQSMIEAAMISEMWNTGEVAIFKWSKDHDLAKWGFNPCFDGNKHDLDKYVACINGHNYLIAKQITKDEQGDARNWPDIGSDEESLKEYKLDHATVINAAERTQNRADRFIPRGIDNLGELFTEASTQPEGDRSKYLTYFNVPVCNLNDVNNFDKYQDHLSGEVQFCTSEKTAGNLVPFCVAHMLAINCRKLSLPGGEWPYQNDIVA
ncbi:related to acetylxylan esterase [Fusarium fujikuroi]|nr:related to acetylxylan esterase [Fusarium fujikuroi]SCV36750.1 related to acetylxylan esterase [Fusarium fujikuroi]